MTRKREKIINYFINKMVRKWVEIDVQKKGKVQCCLFVKKYGKDGDTQIICKVLISILQF